MTGGNESWDDHELEIRLIANRLQQQFVMTDMLVIRLAIRVCRTHYPVAFGLKKLESTSADILRVLQGTVYDI